MVRRAAKFEPVASYGTTDRYAVTNCCNPLRFGIAALLVINLHAHIELLGGIGSIDPELRRIRTQRFRPNSSYS